MNSTPAQAAAAEFLGTFALVLFGCGSIVLPIPQLDSLAVSVAFGAVISVMIITLGDISGAHFNPAVSFAFWIRRELSSASLIWYIIMQFAGAAAAGLVLSFFAPSLEPASTLPHIGAPQTLLVELLISFLLMRVIIYVSRGGKEKGMLAGFAVGGYVFLAALVFGPLTGASMNPARSLGPALFSREAASHLWLYLLAPLAGTSLASFVGYRHRHIQPETD